MTHLFFLKGWVFIFNILNQIFLCYLYPGYSQPANKRQAASAYVFW